MTDLLVPGDAKKRINEIAEVTQPAVSPSSSDRPSVPGARAWDFTFEGGKYHRTSEVMWSPSDSPDIV